MHQERKRQHKAAATAAAAVNGGDAGNLDWLQAVGFDEAYLEQERALGLQKGHVPPGFVFDPGALSYRLANVDQSAWAVCSAAVVMLPVSICMSP